MNAWRVARWTALVITAVALVLSSPSLWVFVIVCSWAAVSGYRGWIISRQMRRELQQVLNSER